MNVKRHVYLVKADDELISHCKCPDAMITFPPQMDCPWCGCGWLFTCIECRRAFTFAVGTLVNETWEETARRDLQKGWGGAPSAQEVADWVAAMKELLADVQTGRRYVCLDGRIIAADETAIDFDGWHSRHQLDVVPHVAALEDRSILEKVLGNREYWQATRIEQD